MDELRLNTAAAAAMTIVDDANALIAAREPWKLARARDGAALDAVLWGAAERLRQAALLVAPFMPASAAEILQRLGVPHDLGALRLDRDARWQPDGERRLQQGPLLWPRLEAPEPAAVISTKETRVTDQPGAPSPARPADAAATVPATPASLWPAETRITIDDFMRVDLRVARVLTAERVPNSRKLVKMSIDLGTEQRTIVAGIAEAYEAEVLVGRHVVVVANLKPAKLMGIESNGMVLAASPEGGAPILVAFDQPPAPGTRVR